MEQKDEDGAAPRVCVVGSSNMDLISYVQSFPRPGETVLGKKFQTGFGGKGANQCIIAAKLGAKVGMLTKLGKDMFGDGMRKNFIENGVDPEFILTDSEEATGVAPITVAEDGENTIVVVPGANFKLTVEEVEKARPMIKQSSVLLCQNEIRIECTLKALQIAREEGVTSIFSAAPAPEKPSDFPDEIFKVCDLLCVNETELFALSDKKDPNETNEEKAILVAAKGLIEKKGVKQVLVTLGGNGCLFVSANQESRIPAHKVSSDLVIDTVGAGDCFAGSLGHGIASGLSISDAISRASLIASISIQKKGTQTSYPSLKEVEQFEENYAP